MDHGTSLLPAFGGPTGTDPVTLTALAFLSQFTNGNTYEAYKTDLRIFFAWCTEVGLHPFDAKRAHLQVFAGHLAKVRGNGPAAISRRIGTIAGFYKTAVLDDIIEHSPCLHLKLPKIQEDPTRRTWLTRWELGAVLRAARESTQPSDWALATILGTVGMRVSATCDLRIEDFDQDPMGYRTFRTIVKNSKPSVKVLPVSTWQAIDRAIDGRASGPLLLRRDGTQMNRRSAALVVERLCKSVGINKHITPHSFRRSFVTLAIMAGVPIEVVAYDVDHASTRTTATYNRLTPDPSSRATHTVAALLASAC